MDTQYGKQEAILSLLRFPQGTIPILHARAPRERFLPGATASLPALPSAGKSGLFIVPLREGDPVLERLRSACKHVTR